MDHDNEEEDATYRRPEGLSSAAWGPAAWHLLHAVSFGYPVDPSLRDKERHRAMLMGLRDTLPCSTCRRHFRALLARYPPTNARMASRDAFSRYVYDLHEHVNASLDKPPGPPYEEVRAKYERMRASEDTYRPLRSVVTVVRALKTERRRRRRRATHRRLFSQK